MTDLSLTDLEFDDLLDAVSTVMAPAPVVADANFAKLAQMPPRAANDNSAEWPYLPFPPGWSASC